MALNLVKRFRQALTALFDGMHPRDSALARWFGSGSRTKAGIDVTEESSMQIAAVYAAVRILSETTATLPLCVYRARATGGKDKYLDHPAFTLLHDAPNSEMTACVYRETSQAHLLLWGNCYSEIEWRLNGTPRALWPIEPWRVNPERTDGRLRYRVDGQRLIDSADMLHIPGLGWDGVKGKSVISWARESLGLTLAVQDFGAAHFGNGVFPGGFLEHPGELSKQARENLVTSFERRHQGTENANRLAVLQEGMKFNQVKISPEDSQFLQTRQFQIAEIARWFNVPPHLLRDLSRATFSNIEEQGIEFVVYSLRPWLVRWEQELNRKLLKPPLVFSRFNIDGLLRGNTAQRSAYYRELFNIGVNSINDVLDMEDRNPIGAAGDVHFVPANMQPVDRAVQEPAQPAIIPPVDDAPITPPVDDVPSSDVPPAETYDQAVLLDRIKDCALAALCRMARKEAKAARAAAKRPSAFLDWLGEFYPKHQTQLTEALEPALGPEMAGGLAARIVTESSERLLDLAGNATADELPGKVDLLVTQWEDRRPQAILESEFVNVELLTG